MLHRHGVREVKVFPNGTDATPLAELEGKPLRQPVRLIAVSRLAPNKRVDHAIQAASLLLQKGVEAHLTVVGTGEVEAQLRQMANQPGLADMSPLPASSPRRKRTPRCAARIS